MSVAAVTKRNGQPSRRCAAPHERGRFIPDRPTQRGELRHRGIGLVAPEAVEAVRGDGTNVVVGVEVERVSSIELDVHGGDLLSNRSDQHGRSLDTMAVSTHTLKFKRTGLDQRGSKSDVIEAESGPASKAIG